MHRGRNWYGPGFWKCGTGWTPGSGGFRGGANPYVNPEMATPGWRPCFYWGAPAPFGPNEEAEILKEKSEYLRSELEAIEKRLKELEKEESRKESE